MLTWGPSYIMFGLHFIGMRSCFLPSPSSNTFIIPGLSSHFRMYHFSLHPSQPATAIRDDHRSSCNLFPALLGLDLSAKSWPLVIDFLTADLQLQKFSCNVEPGSIHPAISINSSRPCANVVLQILCGKLDYPN
jgi:hypothetical protein